jgi:serine/threonine-protein kinase TNNI3K
MALPFVSNPVMAGMAAQQYLVQAYYSGPGCEGTPYLVNANPTSNCSEFVCSGTGVAVGTTSTECTTDYMAALRSKFGSFPYILEVYSRAEDCSTASGASAFLASGNCEGSFNANASMGVHFVATFETNGSATVQYFSGSPCVDEQWIWTEEATQEMLKTHSCDARGYAWYSSFDNALEADLSIGGIVGIPIAGLVVLVMMLVMVFVCRNRRSRKLGTQSSLPLTTVILQADETVLPEIVSSDRSALWTDDVIVASRVPRDKIKVKRLISRGAYGEVYLGSFNRKPVAIKMLVAATRASLQQVSDLLAEAKMTAAMDHPNIVAFVGVAWDSLSDVCVVLEFMDGGDLRALLNKYQTNRQPVGFNRVKTTIALQVCHALAYLHSLRPSVVHRDLKSRNILLNRAMTAKLTDFGVSRERPDHTMTAGVGTSLWMAPEVMLGEKYDDKADMFSFGVVLSELDVHTLPYARTKTNDIDSRQMVDATLLQKITTGEARVGFSKATPVTMVELGQSCVSLDPSERPSAAEALYKLQLFLAQMPS